MSINEITKGGSEYIGYDYKTVTLDSSQVSLYLDSYKNFGWIRDESIQVRLVARFTKASQYASVAPLKETVQLKLKRDRKILNKAELTRLQQHFESCMDEIAALEQSKTKKASVYAITAGIIGTAFMAGSVFAVTAAPPMILLCIVLGIPGIVGWALPYRLFKMFVNKRTVEVTPLIEQKYNEIHEICEKGNTLIHN